MVFQNSSSASAGPAPVTYNNNFQVFFNTNSTAGNAIFNNSGYLEFNDSSTAGSATIINTATLAFQAGSTAGTASIINNSGGITTSTPPARAAARASSPMRAARSTYPG